MPASTMQPGNADAVAFFEMLYPRAKRRNYAGALVTGNERRRWLNGPITVGGVQVRVANSACFDLDEGLTFLGFRECQFIDDQRLPKLEPPQLSSSLACILPFAGFLRSRLRGE